MSRSSFSIGSCSPCSCSLAGLCIGAILASGSLTIGAILAICVLFVEVGGLVGVLVGVSLQVLSAGICVVASWGSV